MALALGCAALTYGCLIWPHREMEGRGIAMPGEDAWPLDEGPVATFLPFGALVTIFLVPLVAICVAAWAATWAWLDWQALPGLHRALLLAGAAVAVAVVAFHFSPPGRELARGWIG